MTKTTLLYLEKSYVKTATASVVEITNDGNQDIVILNQTIFYPMGGGQPADHGEIKGKNGSLLVKHVSYNGGAVQHKGQLTGNIKVGDEVELTIDWERRYRNMQLHTSGHLIDIAIKKILPDNKPLDATHGINDQVYIEYADQIDETLAEKIAQATAEIISQSLPITTEMVSREELEKRQVPLPPDLPTNKDLRLLIIGGKVHMPDGGTHLKNTSECQPVHILRISPKKDRWRVYYNVGQAPMTNNAPKSTIAEKTNSSGSSLKNLKAAITELKSQFDKEDKENVAELKTKYLGKKGALTELMKSLKDVPKDMRPQAGQLLNELRENLEQQLTLLSDEKIETHEHVDLTMPGIKPKVGHMHPISQAMEDITHIFEKIGFTRVRHPEVDWDWYAFESLNMPPNHPARDDWETFFVDVPDTTKDITYDASQPLKRHPSVAGGKLVLTPHTSNGQVREMERMGKPPIRMINIARCYRRQQDATHTQMFHQFEGLVVDKGITIQHLKGTLDYFAEQFYGPGTKSRIRPFHFQFTEPSFEVDFSCHICHGTGKLDSGDKCKFCKSGWHEVGGAGMVHPNVLKAGKIDPTEYTGFAFGWGIERTYTLREGLNIDDIRLLYSGDMRFLEQF